MVNWSNPNGFQLEALHEAIIFAYPTPPLFNVFLQLRLGKGYDEVAPYGQPYDAALLQVLIRARGEGWLPELVRKALRDKPNSPKLVLLEHSYQLTGTTIPPALGWSLEDIVRKDAGFKDLLPWVMKLLSLARRICRIEYPVGQARGTGWLAGADLVMTNWHVINRALPLHGQPEWNYADIACRFDYAVNDQGTTDEGTIVRLSKDWCVDSSPPSPSELGTGSEEPSEDTLDYAVLRLAMPIGSSKMHDGSERGWVEITTMPPRPDKGEIILVLQHPDGSPVKLEIGTITSESRNNKLRILHNANTLGGSSGSALLNAGLELIGLHHAGDQLYNAGKLGNPMQNQAVPIGAIVNRHKPF